MQMLVRWFNEQSDRQDRVAFMLPLYYLQRGRTAEALHAYTTVKEAISSTTGESTLYSLLCMPTALSKKPSQA